MIRFLLDTDILSLFLHGHPGVTTSMRRHRQDESAVSIITVEETFLGRHATIRRARNRVDVARGWQDLLRLMNGLKPIEILPFDDASLTRFESLRAMHRRIRGNDLRVAAIALEHGLVLVTRNLRDFSAISGLTTVDWSV